MKVCYNGLFLVLSILTSSVGYGQEFNLDIQNTTLAEYLEGEKMAGGKEIPNTAFYVSNSQEAQPICFVRRDNELKEMEVSYYFKEQDSVMTAVKYAWNDDSFSVDTDSVGRQSMKFQKLFRDKYFKVVYRIAEVYGNQSYEHGDISNLSKTDTPLGIMRKDVWKVDDAVEIVLFTRMSNYYYRSGMMTVRPSFGMELRIRTKKE
jgi:hypothetical protein